MVLIKYSPTCNGTMVPDEKGNWYFVEDVATQAKKPTLDSLIENLSGYGSNYQAGAVAMYEAMCRYFGCA